MLQKNYSTEGLEKMAGGNNLFVTKMIASFLENIPTDLASLKKGAKEEDLTLMGKTAHKMKPALDMFRIVGAPEWAREIEATYKGKKEEEMSRLVFLAEQIIIRIEEVLSHMMQSTK